MWAVQSFKLQWTSRKRFTGVTVSEDTTAATWPHSALTFRILPCGGDSITFIKVNYFILCHHLYLSDKQYPILYFVPATNNSLFPFVDKLVKIVPENMSHLLVQCMAATLGGFTTTILTNPLDVCRTRLQVSVQIKELHFDFGTSLVGSHEYFRSQFELGQFRVKYFWLVVSGQVRDQT